MHRKHGFTLIESLLSVAVVILVLAIIYSAYHTVLAVQSSTSNTEQGPSAAMETLSQLTRDIMCGIPVENSCLIAPASASNSCASIELITAIPDEQHADTLRWHSIQRVSYVARPATPNRWALYRESHPLLGPLASTTITNLLLNNLEYLSFSALQDDTTFPEWQSSTDTPWPQAITVVLQLKNNSKTFETTVLCPTSIKLKPSP